MPSLAFEKAINYIFGGKNRQVRCKAAHLFFVERKDEPIISVDLPGLLEVHQSTANRVMHDFIQLGLVKEKGIAASGIKSRQARYYETTNSPAVQKIEQYAELIKILSLPEIDKG